MICRLCQQEKKLCESHLIPKFVGQWIKNTSRTGYFRKINQPNIRRQDTDKIYLLCKDCENLFSKREKIFREEIFTPYVQEVKSDFLYHEWLPYFAVSLVWRAAIVLQEKFRDYRPYLAPDVEKAISSWGEYLLNGIRPEKNYTHHLLFANCIEDDEEGITSANKFKWHLLRSTDLTIPASDTEVAIFVKIPGIIFWSCIRPISPVGWENTQIHEQGRIGNHDQIAPEVTAFLVDRFKRFANPDLINISDKQRRLIRQSISKKQE